jgi:hypothetical protein
MTSDIVSEVSKRTGYSIEQVSIVMRYLYGKGIADQFKEEDVFSMRIPFVGHLILKIGYLNKYLKSLEKYGVSTHDNKKYRLWKKKVKIFNESYKEYQDEMTEKGYLHFDTPHLKRAFMNTHSKTLGRLDIEHEEYQNYDIEPERNFNLISLYVELNEARRKKEINGDKQETIN